MFGQANISPMNTAGAGGSRIGAGAKTRTTWTCSKAPRVGLCIRKMLSWIGEEGPEAVSPLRRTPRALSLLDKASDALGVSTTGIGPLHFSININEAAAEASEQVQVALLRAQEQLEAMLEDILRRHRREQFA